MIDKMTLNRKVLKRVHSPIKSPKRNNTSLRKKALIRRLSSEVQFGAASKANLKVVVRVRPQNQREQENNARCVVNIIDDHMLVFDPKEEDDGFFFRGVRQRTRDLNKRQNKEQKFVFEKIFNEESTNEYIYESTTKDLINTVLSGYNCSVFAYGATGAGKTFTMLGKVDAPGITFLTLMELYRRIEEIKEEKTCEVRISYIEVYNEMVRDLLQPGKPLNVQENGQQVFVRQHDRIANVKAIAKLSMIDLAGSERGASTGFKGARFREGASINKSLLALGNCINALADGQRHIPYRDSKLTRLLKDSLGGNCRSVMIAAVSSASTTFEDTFNTLRYANRAKTIKTTIKKNLLNVDQHVSNYVKIVDELRQELCSMKEKEKSRDATVSGEESPTPAVTEEEAEAQARLLEACRERKALRWELLQLESSQRETEFKSMSKCERTLCNLNNLLSQMRKLQQSLQAKLSVNSSKLEYYQSELNRWGPNSCEPSAHSQQLIEKNQANLALRDLHQVSEYLKGMVQEGFNEQNASEQLINVLLMAARRFYVQLRAYNNCTPEMEEVFKGLVESMDESKVIWADQQSAGGEQEATDTPNEGTQAPLDVSYFTFLPTINTFFISPATVQEPAKVFRKSSLKSSVSVSQSSGGSITSVTPRRDLETIRKVLPVVPETEDDGGLPSTPMLGSLSRSPVDPVSGQDKRPLPVIAASVQGMSSVMGSLKETPLPREKCKPAVPSVVIKGTETFGFVSMVNGCGVVSAVNSLVPGSNMNTTELLQDIQPLECSINATVAITPAEGLNTTVDLPNNPVALNTTVDVPSVSPNSSTSTTTTTEVPTKLSANSTFVNAPQLSADPNTTFDKPVPSKTTANKKLLHSDTRINLQVSNAQETLESQSVVDLPVNSIDKSLTNCQANVDSLKTASRQLFQSCTLDSTFSVEETRNRERCSALDLQSPDVSAGQARQTTFEIPERRPLLSLENKAKKPLSPLPTVVVELEGSTMLPTSKEHKISHKHLSGHTPQKTPGKTITPWKNSSIKITPGKISTSANKLSITTTPGMRRCVSTPSLAAAASNVTANKLIKPSPNIKRKFTGLGGALHRTTSFLKGRTSAGNNQENVPPGSRFSCQLREILYLKVIWNSNNICRGGHTRVVVKSGLERPDRQTSIASDDEDSDRGNQMSYKERRREAHTQAEQKRRNAINKGYDSLQDLVPTCQNTEQGQGYKMSKATFLKKEKSKQEEEVAALQKEVVALTIMKLNYEQIVSAHQSQPGQMSKQISDDVKFQVFRAVMDSLNQSFERCVATNNFAEISGSVISWVEEHCKPQILREIMCGVLQQLGRQDMSYLS
ncbi:kinesin-like protein KIF18-like [Homarus americanus]|uniref:Kinesin-like protein KIF18-like n=1 Tax=Homarus americanus TaxID=6706 RepID=A0A8J5MYF4_HOMAM|nr:kinesin-like protein KIF18-like [Homarus americanus]